MCKFTGKIKQIIPFKGEIKKIDSFVGEFIKNYKPPVYDNELPIEWNTVEIANAGNKMYPYAPANRVKISSLVPTIEELEWMKIIRSSGGSEYELIFDSSVTNTEGYNVATFKNTAYNIAEYFTIVPKGENIPHGLYWYTNIFSSNDVTESGWNYKLYLPVAYDDEFPLEWNSLEVSKLANAKDGPMVKISNLTPTSEEMESIVLTIGNETFTFYKSIVTNQGMSYFYESGDNKFFVDVITNLVGAFPPTETGIYVEDVYYYYGTNVDYTASIVEQPDIPVEPDIPDTPTQYLYGHVAAEGETPDVIMDGVGYVGAVLPTLPEWDREKYSHVMLVKSDNDGVYRLVFSTSNRTVMDRTDYVGKFVGTIYDGSGFTSFGYELRDGVWTLLSESAGGYHLVVWSNYDVCFADGTVYLPASEPIPLGEIVGYSYNGTVLPELPDGCKYAFIYKVSGFIKGYQLWCGNEVVFSNNNVGFSGEYHHYNCKSPDFTEWTELSGGTDMMVTSCTSVEWANFDVLDDSGAVALAKSDPIPVYE